MCVLNTFALFVRKQAGIICAFFFFFVGIITLQGSLVQEVGEVEQCVTGGQILDETLRDENKTDISCGKGNDGRRGGGGGGGGNGSRFTSRKAKSLSA